MCLSVDLWLLGATVALDGKGTPYYTLHARAVARVYVVLAGRGLFHNALICRLHNQLTSMLWWTDSDRCLHVGGCS